MSLIEKLAATPFAPFRRSELLANIVEDAMLLISWATSMKESAWRGEVYEARSDAVEVRRVLIGILQDTAEVQELEGAMRQIANGNEEAGDADE